VPIVTEALESAKVTLKEIDGIAVTQGPGLVGSLLVGLSFAKSAAFASDCHSLGHHIEAHLSAIFLEEKPPRFPFIGLVVSGATPLFFVWRGSENSRDWDKPEMTRQGRLSIGGQAFGPRVSGRADH